MFKVGQKVWCVVFGEGEVKKILTHDTLSPVVVNFGDSAPEEIFTLDGKICRWANQTLFPYPVEIVKKVTKPSINWKHVDSTFNYLAEDLDGTVFLYEKEPYINAAQDGWEVSVSFGEVAEAHVFASYVKGTCDWEDSLVKRPEGDSHED